MKKWTSKTLASILSASLVLSAFPLSSHAVTYKTAKDAVKNLTTTQRELIKKATATPSFKIDPQLLKERGPKVNVIVELKTESVAEVLQSSTFSLTQKATKKKEQKVKIEKEQKTFKDNVTKIFKEKKLTVPKITRTYSNTFNGIALEVQTEEIETLLKTNVVKRIWKDEIVQVPQPVKTEVTSKTKALPTPLPHIGADKLHQEGINGSGIKVGVLDTGIDYNHPDLKDRYKGGYDFVDNDSDPMETTYEDWQTSGWPENMGSSYYTSHGTHVAGTIAANPKNDVEYAMTGVAPNVDLYAYRVLGPYGSGATAGIMAAIEKSVTDGMDVINLSLGSQINQSLSPLSIAINNAAQLGVVPVVAAGNAGNGAATLGTPGTSPLAITVGASTVPTNVPKTTITYGSTTIQGKLLGSDYGDDETTVLNKQFNIVHVGLGNTADFTGKDVKGKIALISRGTIGLDVKIENAKANGAVAVIMYNNVEGELPHFLTEIPELIPAFKITQADGKALIDVLAADPSLTISIGDLRANVEPGDTLADFSSRGPVSDNYDIKPDVVAPGVNTFSTYPEFIYSKEDGIDYSKAYASISGTSMATPHVAGVAALVLQQHPEYNVSDVKAALMNTADPLSVSYNVYEVGSGRVDAYEAVYANNLVQVIDQTTSVDNNGDLIQIEDITGSLVFGALYDNGSKQTKSLPVQITNLSDKAEQFNVSVEFLNIKNISGSSLDAKTNGVTLTTASTVDVAANGVATLNTTLNVPATAEKGIYQGYVYLKNKSNPEELFQIPFAVKYSDKGFVYAQTDRYATSNDWENYHPGFYPFVTGILKLSSPMETIDIVISDLKSGKPLGYVSQLDAEGAAPEVEYFLFPLFSGYYYPILSKKEIGKPTRLPEGEYKLSYVGTDENGDTYEVGNPLIIDNTKPVMTYKKGEEPGLREVKKSSLTVEKDNQGIEHEALWFHGTIYDSTVERLAQLGYKTDYFGYPMNQSSNNIVVYQDSAFPSAQLFPAPNGDFKFGVTWDELAEYPSSIALFGFDYATAGDMNYDEFFLAKEDQTYNVTKYNKTKVKLGDTFTATFSIKNANKITGALFTPYIGEQYRVKPVLNPSFVAAVKKAGGTAKLVDKSTEHEHIYSVEITNGVKVSGDLDVLDLQATVLKDDYYRGTDGFTPWYSFKYIDESGNKKYLPSYTNTFKFIPKSSALELYLGGGEALQDNWSINYNELGARSWIVSPSGKIYDAQVDSQGLATFKGIPASLKDYKLYVDIPGHFLYASPVTLGKTSKDGKTIGVSLRWYTDSIAAGDVNRDGKINKKDEAQIRSKFGTGGIKVVEDLNKDNVVDETDVAFVIKNNNLRNPYPIVKKEIR